jgi:hypothetical protein
VPILLRRFGYQFKELGFQTPYRCQPRPDVPLSLAIQGTDNLAVTVENRRCHHGIDTRELSEVFISFPGSSRMFSFSSKTRSKI